MALGENVSSFQLNTSLVHQRAGAGINELLFIASGSQLGLSSCDAETWVATYIDHKQPRTPKPPAYFLYIWHCLTIISDVFVQALPKLTTKKKACQTYCVREERATLDWLRIRFNKNWWTIHLIIEHLNEILRLSAPGTNFLLNDFTNFETKKTE